MRLRILVKPNARRNAVEVRGDGSLAVFVTAPPREGRANEKLIEVLAEHFHRPKRDFTIISGSRSKIKIVEVR